MCFQKRDELYSYLALICIVADRCVNYFNNLSSGALNNIHVLSSADVTTVIVSTIVYVLLPNA